jgi:hypothetical protein
MCVRHRVSSLFWSPGGRVPARDATRGNRRPRQSRSHGFQSRFRGEPTIDGPAPAPPNVYSNIRFMRTRHDKIYIVLSLYICGPDHHTSASDDRLEPLTAPRQWRRQADNREGSSWAATDPPAGIDDLVGPGFVVPPAGYGTLGRDVRYAPPRRRPAGVLRFRPLTSASRLAKMRLQPGPVVDISRGRGRYDAVSDSAEAARARSAGWTAALGRFVPPPEDVLGASADGQSRRAPIGGVDRTVRLAVFQRFAGIHRGKPPTVRSPLGLHAFPRSRTRTGRAGH